MNKSTKLRAREHIARNSSERKKRVKKIVFEAAATNEYIIEKLIVWSLYRHENEIYNSHINK